MAYSDTSFDVVQEVGRSCVDVEDGVCFVAGVDQKAEVTSGRR